MESSDTGSGSNREQTDRDPTETESSTDQSGSGGGWPLRRRDALISILGIGGLGLLGSEHVSAQQGPPPRSWNQDVDAQGNRLLNLGVLTMDGNQTEIADFEGSGLNIDSNSVLNATVTGSNLGSGATVFAGQSGADLEFRSLVGGSNVSLTVTNDEIEVTATDTDTDTRTNVSDDGTEVVTDVSDIDFASELDVSDDGDGSVTVDVSSVSPWDDADGDDLLEAPGFDGIDLDGDSLFETGGPFTLQSSSGTPIELNTDGGSRALTLGIPETDKDGATTAGNVVAGYPKNSVEDTAVGAVIAGGGAGTVPGVSGDDSHTVKDAFGTIGGGRRNTVGKQGRQPGVGPGGGTVSGGIGNEATSNGATIGGGIGNEASERHATVAGGNSNRATDQNATVAGGSGNVARDFYAAVGGGTENVATGEGATIPGGEHNRAEGRYSFAAGGKSEAADRYAFVWNDSSEYHTILDTISTTISGLSSEKTVTSSSEPTGEGTFSVSAQGGVRFVTGPTSVTYISSGSTGWSTTSARSAKTNIDPVDPEAVLDGITDMEVATWEYADDDGGGKGVRHIGPMAGEFHEAVDVGDSDDHINSINADGAAFAAIQGLSLQLDEKEERIDSLEAERERRNERIDELERENERLRERLTNVEDRLAGLETTQTPPTSDD